MAIATSWIEQRAPARAYVCGSGAAPSGAALAELSNVRELAWWTWSPSLSGLAIAIADVHRRAPLAGGTLMQLTPELDQTHPLPSGLGQVLGLSREPRLFLGLTSVERPGG